jgi:hypothetical protein
MPLPAARMGAPLDAIGLPVKNRMQWLVSLLLAAVVGAALTAWAAGSLGVRLAIEHEVPVEFTRALRVNAVTIRSPRASTT